MARNLRRHPVICVVCGTGFLTFTSNVKRGDAKCCSLRCRAKFSSVPADDSPAALKRRAHRKVFLAVCDGVLVRPDSCPKCGSSRQIEAHHDDYTAPLVVRWMCRACHRKEHAPAPVGLGQSVEARAAYARVRAGLKSGEIERTPCAECGDPATIGFYGASFEHVTVIEWRCLSHHSLRRRALQRSA